LGANINEFPFTSAGFISAAAFMGGLIGFSGVLYLYWVQLNIFQTLGLLLPLSALLTISGRRMLSDHAVGQSVVKK
jgi:hypothetical protein